LQRPGRIIADEDKDALLLSIVRHECRVVEEEIPFLMRADAERFARKFPPERKVTVRVHPDFDTITRFYGVGQK
jgi:hypothetical protein